MNSVLIIRREIDIASEGDLRVRDDAIGYTPAGCNVGAAESTILRTAAA